ncbi:MAG: TubC N-terminal docking domain-related protein [Gammaproteobacteria bacterium]
MNAPQLIRECRQRGIALSPNGDKLHVVPASKVTPELKEALIQHKPGILAVLAHEDATEYAAERSAICAADDLPPAHLRPIFEYCLADDPHVRLIMLGYHGETLDEARASLFDRFGFARVVGVQVYVWPSPPAVLQ